MAHDFAKVGRSLYRLRASWPSSGGLNPAPHPKKGEDLRPGLGRRHCQRWHLGRHGQLHPHALRFRRCARRMLRRLPCTHGVFRPSKLMTTSVRPTCSDRSSRAIPRKRSSTSGSAFISTFANARLHPGRFPSLAALRSGCTRQHWHSMPASTSRRFHTSRQLLGRSPITITHTTCAQSCSRSAAISPTRSRASFARSSSIQKTAPWPGRIQTSKPFVWMTAFVRPSISSSRLLVRTSVAPPGADLPGEATPRWALGSRQWTVCHADLRATTDRLPTASCLLPASPAKPAYA